MYQGRRRKDNDRGTIEMKSNASHETGQLDYRITELEILKTTMPATIVVGGQYGSEGKGKVVALLASRLDAPWLVRCGGPNSGHTVRIDGADIVLRQVPCCPEPAKATFCVAAGCVIDEETLIGELDALNVDRNRIIVDPRAVIVTEADRDLERRELRDIASTCSGTGAALVRRMSRRIEVPLAKDSSALHARCRIETVAPLLHDVLDSGGDVVVEGTQGFALSLLHGPHYPFVTSRDTTAAGFAMEVGLSPRLINDIIMVVRTFPIRVGGPSGPFADEISWDEIREISGAPAVFPEYTSVTKRLRRVARFDIATVKSACQYNRPTSLAVMGLDRIDYANTGVEMLGELSQGARDFLVNLEVATGIPVEFAGTGFGTFDAVSVRVPNAEFCHA
jgi:adenylosuccinate synthase